MEGAISCQIFKAAIMLRKSRQRNTFIAYMACEAGDNAELQIYQVLSISVNAESRPFREK